MDYYQCVVVNAQSVIILRIKNVLDVIKFREKSGGLVMWMQIHVQYMNVSTAQKVLTIVDYALNYHANYGTI